MFLVSLAHFQLQEISLLGRDRFGLSPWLETLLWVFVLVELEGLVVRSFDRGWLIDWSIPGSLGPGRRVVAGRFVHRGQLALDWDDFAFDFEVMMLLEPVPVGVIDSCIFPASSSRVEL